MFSKIQPRGFGLLEILIVAGLVALVIPSMFQFGFFMTGAMNRRIAVVEATYLAQEGIEAVRTVRDRGWTTEIASLDVQAQYYPVIVGSNWTLTTTSPGLLQGMYERVVTVQAVGRDGSDNIVEGGVIDPKTRLVTSVVSWTDAGTDRSVTLASYITDFKDN